jgi:hypothetical protein
MAVLTNRDWATLFWLGALFLFILWKPNIRRSIRALLALFFQPKILVPFVLFLGWMLLAVMVGARVGIWEPSMTKDTLLWVVPGFALFVGSIKAAEEPHFFRRRIRNAIGMTALLEFYLNLGGLDLVWELLLQPAIFFLAAMSVVAGNDPKTRPVKRLADLILVALVLWLLIVTTSFVIANAASLESAETLRTLALPAWMTLAALPYVYLLSLWASYELLFIRMRIGGQDARIPWRVKLAAVSALHVRNRAVHSFAGAWPRKLGSTRSFQEARAVLAKQQRQSKAEEEARKLDAANLLRFAGVPGADSDGRQLDRREFIETIAALESLHTLEMGSYYRDRRYSAKAIEDLAAELKRRGLAVDGFGLRVSRSGQSWFAWRRTPSGWCFAVGAKGAPPSEQYFDGPEPPEHPPGVAQGWRAFDDQGVNWLSPTEFRDLKLQE